MRKLMTAVAAMSAGVIWAAPRQGIPSGCDPAAMSDTYWKIWNAEEQAKIDADIEANRKADAVVAVPVGDGAEVTVEQLDHDFRFGAHIFNFNQLGKKEYNDAYKASYGAGGLFNQATVAYYWNKYEPVPGRLRAGGDYEDTERFWNSLSREEAMEHPFWRRPAAGPVVDFLRAKDVHIHGHILVWGLAKPDWIYDWYCPENEKRAFDRLGIPRHSEQFAETTDWSGSYNAQWRAAWSAAYTEASEQQIAAMAPTFTKEMRRIFRKRVFDVAAVFGPINDSWDVVNESSTDWAVYRKSRTGLSVWKSCYGLMPGDYPLYALLDAKEAFPASAKLAINDWNVAQDFQSQVHDLEREGARVDIVGCQMHLFDTNQCARLAKGETGINWISTPGDIQKKLDMMAELGRPLHVSEITITSPGADEQSRQIQAFLTRNIYRKWFSHKGMMGITWWNTVDGGGVKGEPLVSGLFTCDMKKKPAYLALDELINKEWKTREKVKAEGQGQGEGGFVKFRGFRGKYRISWICPRCGGRHGREVYVLGGGLVETKKLTVDDTCLRCVRNFTVDGKEHVLSPNEMSLDLAKLYPSGAGKDGYNGKQWVKVGFTLVAPKAGVYKLMVHADYYGKFSVNGADPFDFNGPWRGYLPVELTLKEGKNDILYSSRAGSSGKWDVMFRLPAGSSLNAL